MTSSLLLALALALAPAALCWWSGRQLARRLDDPALPELLLAQNQRLLKVTTGGFILLAFFAGDHWFWVLPVLLLALFASHFPLRRSLFGERWSIASYLRYGIFSFIGGAGPWLCAAFLPSFVLAVVSNTLPGDDPRRATQLAALLGALLGLAILLWQWQYAKLWLHLHRASPIADTATPSLLARFEQVLERAAPLLHKRPTIHRYGAPGGYVMNAVALPSTHSPAVAFGDTLLATFTEDEIVAVFAHEIAHHEHYNRARLRKAWWAAVALVALSAALPPLLLRTVPGIATLLVVAVPIGFALALGGRAARSRANETASDRRAVTLTGDPAALASALRKLHVYSRVPRRWPHDFERIASHPSLARRIQAIEEQGAVAATSLASPAAIRSLKPGLAVVLDETRAHWFEGVPTDASLDLATLRDRASSYRAVAYSDLTELRVAALGDERVLKATDREGRSWVVALRPEDVRAVQGALDVVDVRLGTPRAPVGKAPLLPARVVAALLFLSLVLANGLGWLILPLALAAWRPTGAALVAMGAMALERALMTVTGGAMENDVMRFSVALAVIAAAALLYLGVKASRRRDDGNALPNEEPTWRESKSMIAMLAVGFVLFVVPLVPSLANAPRAALENPLMSYATTALLGLGAALMTFRRRAWRIAGTSSTLCAAAVIVTLAGADRLFDRRPPVTFRDRNAHEIASIPLEAGMMPVELSPGGRAFMARQVLPSRNDDGSVSRFVIGRVRADSIERARNTLTGSAALFLDDARVLVLAYADDDSLVLRTVGIPDSPGFTSASFDTLWQRKIEGIQDPQLFVNREALAWTLAGRDAASAHLVIVSGKIGTDSVARRSVSPDAQVTRALVAFDNGTALAPRMTYPADGTDAIPWTWSLLSMSMQWELVRVGSVRREPAGTLGGYPTCGSVQTREGALCAETGRARSRLWRAPAQGPLVELAGIPRGFGDAHIVDGNHVVAFKRGQAQVALVDVGLRTGVMIRVPQDHSGTSRTWISDATWAGDRVALISYSLRGSRLSVYRVD